MALRCDTRMDVPMDVPFDGDAAAPSPMLGLDGYSGSNYTQTTAGEVGAAGVYFEALLRLKPTVTSGVRTILAKAITGGATRGYALVTSGTNSTIYFQITDNSNVFVTSPVFTVQPSDLAKVLSIKAWHDGSNVRLAIDDAEVGSGTPITGYGTAPAANMRSGFGTTGLGAATDMVIYGVATSRGFPANMAAVQAQFAATKAARKIIEAPWGTSQRTYPVVTNTQLQDVSALADHMTVVGSLSLVTDATPTWRT